MDEEPPEDGLHRSAALRTLPWKRRPGDGLVAGVCAGLSRRFGLPVAYVRALFIVGTLLLCGAPALLYLAAIFAVPRDDSE